MTNLTYCPDDGAEIELTGVDGSPLYNDDGTPMTWTVLGNDSDVAVKARNAQQNLRFQRMGRGVTVTAEAMEADAVSYLVKLTTGWNLTPSKLIPGVDPGLGEGKVAFTPAAAAKILQHPKLAIHREALDAAIAQRARFMKASPAS